MLKLIFRVGGPPQMDPSVSYLQPLCADEGGFLLALLGGQVLSLNPLSPTKIKPKFQLLFLMRDKYLLSIIACFTESDQN